MNWTRKVNPVRRRTAPNETVRAVRCAGRCWGKFQPEAMI